MKAVIWTEYGPPEGLVMGEIRKPVPGDEDILVKVHAVSVNAGDCEMRGLKLPVALSFPLRIFNGFRKPKRIKVLGQDFAGEIEAVGSEVSGFKPGDRVFGSTDLGLGTYTEYLCLKSGAAGHLIEYMPESLDYTEAAAVPVSGLEALFFLKKANIQKGTEILVIGAGGSIGSHGVQLAKHFGAVVTAVDRKEKQELLESLGADRFIDYLSEDYYDSGIKYDVVFDVAGKSKMGDALKILNKKGRYLVLNPTLRKFIGKPFAGLSGGRKIIIGVSEREGSDLAYLRDLIDKGIIKPVIDRVFTLDEMAAAHRYAESGLKKGNVTIRVNH